MTEFPATGGAKSAFEATARHTTTSQLACGTSLAGRYEILQLLGEGGMGAVYKAKDREVGHMVALKVIRPELASRSEVLSRFKQELVLARQVTHKNVIRIFDLGQADGINFITMEFVEGRDLHSLVKDGHKFTIAEKTGIIRQICHALDAPTRKGWFIAT